MAKEVVINLKANTGQAEKNVQGLNEDLQQTQADLGGIEDAGDQMTGGMISGFKGMLASVKSAITGLKTFRGAMIATGIGAFVIAIAAVGTALSNTEEGQNKLNKWLTQISVVIGNVTDILGNFGNALMNVFTLNFKEAKKNIDAVTQGIVNFGEETRKELKIGADIADMRAKADKLERQLQIDRAKADRDRADLLDKAVQKDTYTAQQRIAFLEEAGKLEEEITNKEIEAVQLRVDARVAENALAGSTKEDLEEEATLKAQLIQLEGAKLTKAKLVTTQIIAANAQVRAEEKAAQAEIDAAKKTKDAEDLAAAKKLAEVKKAIREATATSEQEKRDLELIKLDEHFAALILKAKEQNIVTDELDTALKEAKQAKEAEWDAIDLARKQAQTDKENALEAEKTAALKKENADRLLLIEAEVQARRAGIAQIAGLLGQLSGLLEQGTAASKAAALAEILINTGLGFAQGLTIAQASAAGTGPAAAFAFPVFYATQIIAVMAAIGNAKRILSQVKGGGSASGGSSRGPTMAAPPTSIATPPDVTSVGGTGMNQLADAIGSQNQQPIQAFVVSNDVTTAQSLERNIVDGASIG